MTRANRSPPVVDGPARVRRGYFEFRYGQLHVHYAMPPGGGFEEGLPLLCLHDVPGSGRVFTRLLALAGRQRSVYAPDLPGCGESDPPAGPCAISDYAVAVGDFIEEMRLRQLAVLGWRLGAVIATELAVARPSQVERLILLSVPLRSAAELAASPAAAVPAGPDAAFRPPEWLQWALAAAARYPLREQLARVKQRVLVLRPQDDLAEPTARAREVLAAARIAELETTGAEALAASPERVTAPMQEFLRA